MSKSTRGASQWLVGPLKDVYHGSELEGVLRGTHVLPQGWCMGLTQKDVVHKKKCTPKIVPDYLKVYKYNGPADFSAFLQGETKRPCTRCQPLFESEWSDPNHPGAWKDKQQTQQQQQQQHLHHPSQHTTSTSNASASWTSLDIAKSSAMGWLGLAATRFANTAARSAARTAARRLVGEAMKRLTRK